jgi:hypothetical protein
MEQERIEIKLSKRKGMLSFFGSVAFVATSTWVIFYAGKHEADGIGTSKLDTIAVIWIGCIGIIFFGLAAIVIAYKLFDKEPGLIIDTDGIYDNASLASGHWIKWDRIRGIRVEQVVSTRLILIDIEHPEEFMAGVHGIRKKLMVGTYKAYGTPISIPASSLSYDFDELFLTINERFNTRTSEQGLQTV